MAILLFVRLVQAFQTLMVQYNISEDRLTLWGGLAPNLYRQLLSSYVLYSYGPEIRTAAEIPLGVANTYGELLYNEVGETTSLSFSLNVSR